MNNLAQKVNSDKKFKSEAYLCLKQQLDEERAKPLKKRDFDKIDSLSHEISELLDGERQEDYSDGINRLFDRISDYEKAKKKPSIAFRKLIPIVCSAVFLFTANCISVAAWNMNIFSAVIEFTKGGFSVDFGKSDYEVIELPTSENDPYGIVAECAKYDIYIETPHYLPDGFELSLMSNDISDYANYIKFVFRNSENESITLEMTRYWNEVGQIGIPSDHYNISETTVNDKAAIISKEDNQYTIAFQNGKTVFQMFTQDVDYNECDKIVASIK